MSSGVVSPITCTADVSLVRTWDCAELIRRWRAQFQIDITEELRGVIEIEHYRCNLTLLEFFRPLSVAGSEQLYEHLQQESWYYMPHKWEHDVALADLKALQGARVLDVGCGVGTFVKALREAGIDARGIELNRAAVAEAQHLGLPVEQIDLYDMAEREPETFDAVCAFQVLEHVIDPKSFLDAMVRLLKPRGLLILAVPNMDSFLQYDQGHLFNLPPHHMSRWKVDTFCALPRYLPLELMETLEEPLDDYQVVPYVAAHVGRAVPWATGRAIVSRLMQPIYYVPAIRRRCRGQALYARMRKKASGGKLGAAHG